MQSLVGVQLCGYAYRLSRSPLYEASRIQDVHPTKCSIRYKSDVHDPPGIGTPPNLSFSPTTTTSIPQIGVCVWARFFSSSHRQKRHIDEKRRPGPGGVGLLVVLDVEDWCGGGDLNPYALRR